MDKNGKKWDVIVEDVTYRDPSTGVPILGGFTVWADTGLSKLIKSVPGVRAAYEDDNKYSIFLDKRYDRDVVELNIETAIKCRPEEGGNNG